MKTLKSAMLSLALLTFSATSFAQEWSDKQKEVWMFVEEYSQAYESGDYDKFMSVFHKDYKGWGYESPVPMGKDVVGKYIKMGMENYEVVFSNRIPLSIQVYDDFAVVNYMFHSMGKMKGTDEVEEFKGRWTDILMKDGNNWYLLADHGGDYPED